MRSIIGILITSAALALTFCLRTSTAAVGTSVSPQNLNVPFNDLLPPLLDSDAAAITTTTKGSTTKGPTSTTLKTTTRAPVSLTKTTKEQLTTHSPPTLFKSTKKSYYQQQTEHIKELHLIDDDGLIPHNYSEQAQHLQHLHDAQNKEYNQQKQQLLQQKLQKHQREQNLKFQKPQKSQKSSTPVNVVSRTSHHVASQPKKVTSSNVAKTHARTGAEKLIEKPNPTLDQNQSARLQASPTAQVIAQPSQLEYRQQHRFQAPVQPLNIDAFQQYLDFQHTTHRPQKVGLPTLTPFPRHLK